MYRLDPKQAVLDHVAAQSAPAQRAAMLSSRQAHCRRAGRSPPIRARDRRRRAGDRGAAAGDARICHPRDLCRAGQHSFYITVILASFVAANVLFNAARTHRIAAYRTVVKQSGRVLAAWSAVFAADAVGVFLFKASDTCRASGWSPGSRPARSCWSRSASRCARGACSGPREGKLKRRTVIVGGGTDAEALIDAIRRGADSDIRLFGLFDDRDRRPLARVRCAACPKLGRVADLIEFARQTRVDLVIVSMPLVAEKRVLEMLKQLWVLPVDIRLSAHMSKLRFTVEGLFLSRRRAGVRHGRPADLGLEPRLQVAVRQGRRAGRADPAVAGDGRSRRSRSSSRARGRCSSSRSGTASTTS